MPFPSVDSFDRAAADPPVRSQAGGALTITVNPAIGNLQTVVVYLGDTAIPVPKAPRAALLCGCVTVMVPTSSPTYPLRVEVDGAQSLLSQDTNPASPTFGQWLPQVDHERMIEHSGSEEFCRE